MVSKTIICLLVLAAVTLTLGRPSSEEQTRCGERRQDEHDSSSNESDRRDRGQSPCTKDQDQESGERQREYRQGEKKNLKIQDSSSQESQESGRPIKMLTSQEDENVSKRMRNAPEHKPVYHHRQDYTHSQNERRNQQESRNGNDEVDSNENNSKAGYNRISKY